MICGLNRTARYYYYPGWHEPGTMFELIINTDRWNTLPDDIKQIIETAATATGLRIYAQMEYNNEIALREIIGNQNIELLEFPTGVLKTFKQLTQETLEEEAAANPEFKKVYDAYRQFKQDYSHWSKLEESYQDILRK